jgi:UDP:flavonoid glycosyltransferase YjiC (YdhE family)
MVLLPGLAADQPHIAAQMQDWGVGRALAGDAETETIRLAIQDVLSKPSYRRRARERATSLAGVNGAAAAADELEDLAAASAVIPCRMTERTMTASLSC